MSTRRNIYYPKEGIHDIKFGESRDEIRNSIRMEFTEFKRNDFAENTSDFYKDIGMFVEYSNENKCDAIDFSNSSSFIYDDIDLFKSDFKSIKKRFDQISNSSEEEGELNVTYYDLGLSITGSSNNDDIQSILIFSDDYW